MIMIRDVFQAKYGRGDELVQLFKQIFIEAGEYYSGRIMTDLSGPHFTVVTEVEAESMDDFQRRLREGFSQPEFGEMFSRMMELVESGRREFYTIEAEAQRR
jgi:hypothetical protein